MIKNCWACNRELTDSTSKYVPFGLGPICGSKLVEDEWFDVVDRKLCILCRVNKAESVEHPIKSSVIKDNSDGGEQMMVSGGKVKRFTNPKSAKGKDKDLCLNCNNSLTQESDKSFDEFYYSFKHVFSKKIDDKYLENISKNWDKLKEEVVKEISDEIGEEWSKLSEEDQKIVFNAKMTSKALLEGTKFWYKLNHLTPSQLRNIKKYGAKAMSCSLNRHKNPVSKELSQLALGLGDFSKIKIRFSKTCIREYQNIELGMANLSSGYLSNGDCLLVQGFNGLILEFYFSKKGDFKDVKYIVGYDNTGITFKLKNFFKGLIFE